MYKTILNPDDTIQLAKKWVKIKNSEMRNYNEVMNGHRKHLNIELRLKA